MSKTRWTRWTTEAGGALAACLAAAALAQAGCAHGKDESVDLTKPVSGAEASNAEKAYKKGLDEKSGSNYLEATRYFEWVKNNFPYSQFAALSELALADLAFDRDDYAPAATAYADFLKSHPSHPKADYASFRIGLSHYKDRASDFWIFPPSFERDQAPVRAAVEALQKFVNNFPKSALASEAKGLIAECRERLLRHERFVAEFYNKRSEWRGAAGRYESIAVNFGDLHDGKVRGEALWAAGEALHKAGSLASERKTLGKLIAEAPGDEHRPEAEKRLAAIPPEAEDAPLVPDAALLHNKKLAPKPKAAPKAPEQKAPAEPASEPAAPEAKPGAETRPAPEEKPASQPQAPAGPELPAPRP